MSQQQFWIGLALLAAAALTGSIVIWRFWLGQRRENAMLRLLEAADRLEERIKLCRRQLGSAHAAVRVIPGVPSAGSASADKAIDSALRKLLQQRLWIRDQAPDAPQADLQRVASAMEQAERDIELTMQNLDEARRELDDAVDDLRSTP